MPSLEPVTHLVSLARPFSSITTLATRIGFMLTHPRLSETTKNFEAGKYHS